MLLGDSIFMSIHSPFLAKYRLGGARARIQLVFLRSCMLFVCSSVFLSVATFQCCILVFGKGVHFSRVAIGTNYIDVPKD